MIFLYYLTAALVLKIPPETLAGLPFEVEPLVKIAWLVGLIPTLSGLGRVVAGLTIKTERPDSLEGEEEARPQIEGAGREQPAAAQGRAPEASQSSVVEHTTELLGEKVTQRGGP